ncbi:hypothetical protein UFOVP161_12 [uncultured Caudovirales phage]|uniref:Uncharacterized protein n=1 Tax=uncultured Caudovirales phage TaxID=2100421 RepID=A0A6J7WD42_9CAUD|nr:hypothetical protein UFOVP161_12 [uncultured Caudovirales phage]
MNIEQAKQILEENRVEISKNEIYNGGWYLFASKNKEYARLDGDFNVQDLEAILVWMKS